MPAARCNHCGLQIISSSYPKAMKWYHDHLRENHPKVWLRA
ncbi:hypothetical protein [Haladaptatus sp. W1]|nr:hypothetical protein [Haladaptatus sp. W1]